MYKHIRKAHKNCQEPKEEEKNEIESISIIETPSPPNYSDKPHRGDIPLRLLETSLQYVYLVKMPKLVNDKPEYKLGKSHQNNCSRVDKYPKGCKILAVLHVKDEIKIENLLKFYFNKMFDKTRGDEYFSGNQDDILKFFSSVVMKFGYEVSNEDYDF